MNKEKHTINHVAFVLDSSGSMERLVPKTKEVFDNCIKSLREQSLRWNQETRASVYVFDTRIECRVFDMDVTRLDTSYYSLLGGSTALIDATQLAFEDSRLLPQKYGDHAFIVYVITDGEENASKYKSIHNTIFGAPDNYTWAVLVPSQTAKLHASKIGFPNNAIQTWDVSERGMEEVGRQFTSNMETYYQSRSQGIKPSGTFFATDLSKLSKQTVSNNLERLKPHSYKIIVNESNQAVQISELVSSKGLLYQNGKNFYELVKTETVQSQKLIAIQSKKDDSIYYGDSARHLLNLPCIETKVKVGDNGDWNVFIQSTAPNRNIIPKQRVLVLF